MRATYSPSTCGIHHISLRHGLRSFSAKRRRTVSRDMLSCSVSLTIAPADSSSGQGARPSGALEQAVATRRASSLPESLRPAPGRGSSLSAPSRLPSTKRRLVRYTVEPPTPTLVAMSSSLVPASAARKICARLSLRTECLPPLRSAVSSALCLAEFDSIAYIHLCLLGVRGTDEQLNRMSGVSRSARTFTPRQGQYLAFIYAYTRLHRRPPAEADMQQYFRVSPPSVHQMVLTLERAGFIRPQRGVARSIEMLVDPEHLPVL